jgi:hypothetical protein
MTGAYEATKGQGLTRWPPTAGSEIGSMRRYDQDERMEQMTEGKVDECGYRIVNVDDVDGLLTQEGEQLVHRARQGKQEPGSATHGTLREKWDA